MSLIKDPFQNKIENIYNLLVENNNGYYIESGFENSSYRINKTKVDKSEILISNQNDSDKYLYGKFIIFTLMDNSFDSVDCKNNELVLQMRFSPEDSYFTEKSFRKVISKDLPDKDIANIFLSVIEKFDLIFNKTDKKDELIL